LLLLRLAISRSDHQVVGVSRCFVPIFIAWILDAAARPWSGLLVWTSPLVAWATRCHHSAEYFPHMYTPPARRIHLALKIWLEIDRAGRRTAYATRQEFTFRNIKHKRRRLVVCPQPY
jgi:hypothetical protein